MTGIAQALVLAVGRGFVVLLTSAVGFVAGSCGRPARNGPESREIASVYPWED